MKPALACLMLCALSAAARADDAKELKRADEIYTALFADTMIRPDNRHDPQLERYSTSVDARFGYHAEHHWGYELRVFYGRLRTVDAGVGNRSGIGGDAVYRFGDSSLVRPYVLAGFGIAYSDELPGADWIAPYVNAGFGVTSGTLVELWERPLRVRGEIRYSYEDYRDEYTGATTYDPARYGDYHAFVGLEFALYRHVPDAAPAPPEVVPVEQRP